MMAKKFRTMHDVCMVLPSPTASQAMARRGTRLAGETESGDVPVESS